MDQRADIPRKPQRSLGANFYRLSTAFSALRETLISKKFAERLEKPLAFWTTSADRRLPQAFLGLKLSIILATPFADLTATPGIGQKKMASLIKLLQRAAKEEPTDGVLSLAASDQHHTRTDGRRGAALEPSAVSEPEWARWCETVKRHNLERHTLGLLVSSLQSLPTVVWPVSLETYLDHTLAEIRQFKTHGEKRVRVVVEIFHELHAMFGALAPREHLAVRLMPARIAAVDEWTAHVIGNDHSPALAEMSAKLAQPLLDQLLVDLGPDQHRLAEGRLGLDGPAQHVGQQAKRMGVTRARIYQLFGDCQMALAARWPGGRDRVSLLVHSLAQRGLADREKDVLLTIQELFFTDQAAESRAG